MESEGLRTADAAWFDAVLPAFVSTVAPEDLDADVIYDLTWFQVSLYLAHISSLNLHARVVPVVIVPLALDAAPVRRCTLICMPVCLLLPVFWWDVWWVWMRVTSSTRQWCGQRSKRRTEALSFPCHPSAKAISTAALSLNLTSAASGPAPPPVDVWPPLLACIQVRAPSCVKWLVSGILMNTEPNIQCRKSAVGC